MSKPWRVRATAAIEALARSGEDFCSDDLVAMVGHPDTEHHHNGRNSAIGAMFHISHSRGLIEPTGEVRQSHQPHRKGGLVRLWKGVPPDRRGPGRDAPEASAKP
jgi:hypothetical protein